MNNVENRLQASDIDMERRMCHQQFLKHFWPLSLSLTVKGQKTPEQYIVESMKTAQCLLCVCLLMYSLLKKKERQVSDGWSYRCSLMCQVKGQQSNRSTSPVSHPSHAVLPSSTVSKGSLPGFSFLLQHNLCWCERHLEWGAPTAAALQPRLIWAPPHWSGSSLVERLRGELVEVEGGGGDSHQPAREVVVLEASTPG